MPETLPKPTVGQVSEWEAAVQAEDETDQDASHSCPFCQRGFVGLPALWLHQGTHPGQAEDVYQRGAWALQQEGVTAVAGGEAEKLDVALAAAAKGPDALAQAMADFDARPAQDAAAAEAARLAFKADGWHYRIALLDRGDGLGTRLYAVPEPPGVELGDTDVELRARKSELAPGTGPLADLGALLYLLPPTAAEMAPKAAEKAPKAAEKVPRRR